VEIRILVGGARPALEVVDEGPGITEEAMPFIYDRFFRAVPQSIEGSGLGLAIAKSAAERHGLGLSHQNRADRSGLVARITFG
jgi:signal transduction histidine kinase